MDVARTVEQILGYIMTVWWFVTEERKHYYIEALDVFKEAKENITDKFI